MPEPFLMCITPEDSLVDEATRMIESEAVNFAQRFIKDARVREEYLRRSRQFVDELRSSYQSGALSARQAAQAAHQMRNELLDLMRRRSSDLGRAWAERLKARGAEFQALLDKYAKNKFGRAFALVSEAEQKAVLLEVLEAAGRPRPQATAAARRLGAFGRGLWVLSIGIAVYNIGTAEDKVQAAAREGVVLAGGFAGGALGGAAAGLACGPGAPVCVAVGALVGGVLGAILGDEFFARSTAVKRVDGLGSLRINPRAPMF